MQRQELGERLEHFPRIPLAEYPTPLEHLPRLSAELGKQVYAKRDDYLGPGMGGNKTRKLEYLLAEAQQRGARKVVTFGGLQSNHARLTAAAANRLGLETHLFYFERRPVRLEGNLLLGNLLGAKLHFIPLGGGGNGMTIETTSRLVRLAALALVGPHYFIPVGGHTWLGCLGYVQAALEIDEQARQMGLLDAGGRATVVTAAGSGGTLAGLMAGFKLIDSPLKPLGIDVGKLWKGFPASIARLAGEICARLGQSLNFGAADTPLVEETYVGPRYGAPSEGGQAALRRAARLEGLLLDPVYTAKAFAGMLDLAGTSSVQQGGLKESEVLIFLHTGGIPALFAFEETQYMHG